MKYSINYHSLFNSKRLFNINDYSLDIGKIYLGPLLLKKPQFSSVLVHGAGIDITDLMKQM